MNNEELEDDIVDPPEVEEGDEDLTDYKALALKNAGIAKRYKTKFEKSKIAKQVEKGVEKVLESKIDNTKPDYAKLAYLESKGVSEEDYDFILEEATTTGKELKDLLGFSYLKEELRVRKEARESKDALPSGTKRSAGSTRDSVEYWIAKGELPPNDQKQLRRKVVLAKIEASRKEDKFSSRPVA